MLPSPHLCFPLSFLCQTLFASEILLQHVRSQKHKQSCSATWPFPEGVTRAARAACARIVRLTRLPQVDLRERATSSVLGRKREHRQQNVVSHNCWHFGSTPIFGQTSQRFLVVGFVMEPKSTQAQAPQREWVRSWPAAIHGRRLALKKRMDPAWTPSAPRTKRIVAKGSIGTELTASGYSARQHELAVEEAWENTRGMPLDMKQETQEDELQFMFLNHANAASFAPERNQMIVLGRPVVVPVCTVKRQACPMPGDSLQWFSKPPTWLRACCWLHPGIQWWLLHDRINLFPWDFRRKQTRKRHQKWWRLSGEKRLHKV